MDLKVLVVDDNPTVLSIISAYISKANSDAEVFTAANGREAIERLREYEKDFHLIITDLDMPELNGIQLIEYIRDNRPRIPVLVMTGGFDESLLDPISSLISGKKDPSRGSVGFFRKPISFEKFSRHLSAILAGNCNNTEKSALPIARQFQTS